MSRYGNIIGRALCEPPADPKPTPEQLRESLPVNEELAAMWDRLWRFHPAAAEDVHEYLNDYCVLKEYGR